jgi:hypothetical protein
MNVTIDDVWDFVRAYVFSATLAVSLGPLRAH